MKAYILFLLSLFSITSLLGGKPIPPSPVRDVSVDFLISGHLVNLEVSDRGKRIVNLSGRSLSDLSGIEKLNLNDYDVLDLNKNCIKNLNLLATISSNSLTLITVQNGKEPISINYDSLLSLDENNPSLRVLNLSDNKLTGETLEAITAASDKLTYRIVLR